MSSTCKEPNLCLQDLCSTYIAVSMLAACHRPCLLVLRLLLCRALLPARSHTLPLVQGPGCNDVTGFERCINIATSLPFVAIGLQGARWCQLQCIAQSRWHCTVQASAALHCTGTSSPALHMHQQL